MKRYTVTISKQEERALLTDMVSIQDWLDNAIHNKARQCIDRIVEEYSDKQPKKIPLDEKLQIIQTLTLKTAAERQTEIEAQEAAKQ